MATESKSATSPENVEATKSQQPKSNVVPAKTRWVKNAFFNGGTTKYIRLDELHNELNGNNFGQGDMTDEELSEEILRRAGLVEHPRHNDIKKGLTDFFKSIPDPAMKWVNPNHGVKYPKVVEAK